MRKAHRGNKEQAEQQTQYIFIQRQEGTIIWCRMGLTCKESRHCCRPHWEHPNCSLQYSQKDELGRPKVIPFKPINQSSILAIKLKPKKAGEVRTAQKTHGKQTSGDQPSQPISASTLQSGSKRCSQPSRHGCLGDTRTHCTDDKGNKKLDALSKAFSPLSFIYSLWRRASPGRVCEECWHPHQLPGVEIRAGWGQHFAQPSSSVRDTTAQHSTSSTRDRGF